mmetsp:Transcript_42291/g.137277  ORF Transcript_42291/g.137277 Transcript_42291/m.137277 type:complete len:389 (-) Transcript_42291:590-1756(-)
MFLALTATATLTAEQEEELVTLIDASAAAVAHLPTTSRARDEIRLLHGKLTELQAAAATVTPEEWDIMLRALLRANHYGVAALREALAAEGLQEQLPLAAAHDDASTGESASGPRACPPSPSHRRGGSGVGRLGGGGGDVDGVDGGDGGDGGGIAAAFAGAFAAGSAAGSGLAAPSGRQPLFGGGDGGVYVAGSCANQDERCAGWAATGECEANPSFMLSSCADSCTHCRQGRPREMTSREERLKRSDDLGEPRYNLGEPRYSGGEVDAAAGAAAAAAGAGGGVEAGAGALEALYRRLDSWLDRPPPWERDCDCCFERCPAGHHCLRQSDGSLLACRGPSLGEVVDAAWTASPLPCAAAAIGAGFAIGLWARAQLLPHRVRRRKRAAD